MKKILFLSVSDLNSVNGGALGQKAYYNSFVSLFPNHVDLIMPHEFCNGDYSKAIGVPSRNIFESILSGSVHRYKKFLLNYLQKRANDYELCVISGGIYAGDMMEMIHHYNLKILVIHVNYEPEYQMDNKTLLTLHGFTPFFVKKNEKKAYLMADCNCFMSKDDERSFQQNYGHSDAPSIILGAYEYKHTKKPLANCAANQNVMAITGSMNSIQTIEGIRNFRNLYFESFCKICKGWKIVISGRNPDNAVLNFAKTNSDIISVIPNPESMDNIISSSSLFCCPTNVGGGIKLRIMDGLRNGRPVLAHRISARGYEIMHNQPYFKIYHDQKSFEKGLSDLVSYIKEYNPEDVINGYMENFSFEAGTNRLRKAVKYIFN